MDDDTHIDGSHFEVVVVGGGPAGLTTALYTTRLGHETAVINRGGGRAAMMLDTHNVIGVSEAVSGNELLQRAVDQLEGYGATYHRDFVTAIRPLSTEEGGEASTPDGGDGFPQDAGPRFELETTDATLTADRVVLATGFSDARPDPPLPRTGRGLHYCLLCDAHMFEAESVYVMGHGESAATVAMIMLNFTDEVDLLLDGDEPTWSEETDAQLAGHPIDVVPDEVVGKYQDEADPDWLGGFEFADGTSRDYRGGFAMYGSQYNNDLASSLGCELTAEGAVEVDKHGRTSVDGVYGVGDLTPGPSQIPVAMGQGARAGVSLHYGLREFPRSLEDLADEVGMDVDELAGLDHDLESHAAHGDD